MSALIESLLPEKRTTLQPISLEDWASMFQLGNLPLHLNQTLQGNREVIEQTFAGLAHGAYRSNGIIFACMLARFMLFSEARFQYQQLRGGRPGDLFGTAELSLLERPEPGKTTGDLLERALIDVDLAGNYFVARRPGRLKRLRPDWTSIVLGSMSTNPNIAPLDVDAEVVGYIYHPGGEGSGQEPETFLANEVAHFAPSPDPLASYRGMSWLLPILREAMSDTAATYHKLQFFNNAATPNMIVTLDPKVSIATAREWIALFEQEHHGVLNAYKTAYLGGGASGEVVGKDFQQMDFRATQGAGEVRIAAAAGIHPVIVGLSEALQGSSLNQGNFTAARRLVADRTMRPLWRNIAGSLETIIRVPSDARLWYDDRDIPFLAEDRKDAAEVQSKQATSIRTLVDGGFKPEAVIDTIVSGDWMRLRTDHTGLLPVQLQSPGSGSISDEDSARMRYQRVMPTEGNVRATETFWPVSGIAAGDYVEAGAVLLAGDEVVRAFPQFFVPDRNGSGVVFSREEVMAVRRALIAEGKPAGYGSIARQLGISRETVRRRLTQ